MISLSDDQLLQVRELASPLPIKQRDALRMLADELAGRTDIGAGELHRLCIDVRRRITPWTTTMTQRLG